MQDKRQQTRASNQLKDFVAKNLEEAGVKTLKLSKQVRSLEYIEELESNLLQIVSEAVSRFSLIFQTLTGVEGSWWVEKILLKSMAWSSGLDLPEQLNLEVKVIEKTLQSHGLSHAEPLAVESIIGGCFRNPDCQKFPDFMLRRGWANHTFSIYSEHQEPWYWIRLLNPGLIEKFNKAKILL